MTIFGESAGGRSVSILVSVPGSDVVSDGTLGDQSSHGLLYLHDLDVRLTPLFRAPDGVELIAKLSLAPRKIRAQLSVQGA